MFHVCWVLSLPVATKTARNKIFWSIVLVIIVQVVNMQPTDTVAFVPICGSFAPMARVRSGADGVEQYLPML